MHSSTQARALMSGPLRSRARRPRRLRTRSAARAERSHPVRLALPQPHVDVLERGNVSPRRALVSIRPVLAHEELIGRLDATAPAPLLPWDVPGRQLLELRPLVLEEGRWVREAAAAAELGDPVLDVRRVRPNFPAEPIKASNVLEGGPARDARGWV